MSSYKLHNPGDEGLDVHYGSGSSYASAKAFKWAQLFGKGRILPVDLAIYDRPPNRGEVETSKSNEVDLPVLFILETFNVSIYKAGPIGGLNS